MSDDAQSSQILDDVPPEKMEVYLKGKELKEVADKLFKTDPRAALVHYHKVLLHWRGLSRLNPAVPTRGDDASKPKSQLEEDIGKVYSNMSACYLIQKKYDRTIETANEALKRNEDNYKALFRKAKAYGEQGYLEKAEKILTELITKCPAEESTFKTELESFRAKDKERERKANQKLRGFLKSTKEIFDADSAPREASVDSAEPSSAKIEEVKD